MRHPAIKSQPGVKSIERLEFQDRRIGKTSLYRTKDISLASYSKNKYNGIKNYNL